MPRTLQSASRLALCILIMAASAVTACLGSAAAAEVAKGKDGAVRIVFGGDVMLDCGPGHAGIPRRRSVRRLAPILKTADIAVCNLECVVAKHGHQVLKPYTFKARPECAPRAGAILHGGLGGQ